jgi:sugar/nucleoside kinase (ribokinase family)
MSKKMLVGVLVLLLSGMAASAGEPSRLRSGVKTEFDQACLGALGHLPSHYGKVGSEPFSEMAVALIKRCNANPDRMICDVTSKTMMREYGKTPFACGVDTVYTGPVILLPDTH